MHLCLKSVAADHRLIREIMGGLPRFSRSPFFSADGKDASWSIQDATAKINEKILVDPAELCLQTPTR